MQFKHKDFLLFYFAAFLFMLVACLIYVDFNSQNKEITIAALDIGQGDAIFIESPSGTQILFDAGPGNTILRELPKVMPFWDRTIDAVVITNPDADHISGFLDVLKMYKINTVFESGTINPSSTYKNLESFIKNKNIPDILVRKGMSVDIGGGAYIEFLFPDRDVTDWSPNDGSVVARLVYGDTKIMLTGDATKYTERLVLSQTHPNNLQSMILKVGHHGSNTSTSPEFVNAVRPKYSLISSGKSNKYGHPHKETLDTLAKLGVQIFRTDLLGTIVLNCDTMGACKQK